MKLSKGNLYSLKDCLFEILESEFLFSVEKKIAWFSVTLLIKARDVLCVLIKTTYY